MSDLAKLTGQLADIVTEMEEAGKPAARTYNVIFSVIKEFEKITPETHLVCAK